MLHGYRVEQGHLEGSAADEDALWLDLHEPTAEEESRVERLTGLDIPTREDMQEIEASSRLYVEDGAAFMTAMIPAGSERQTPRFEPVSFVLTPARLVTVRYHDPQAFAHFPTVAQRSGADLRDAGSVLISLLEAVVDRIADILERAVREIEGVSRTIFRRDGSASRDSREILDEIGRKGDLTSGIRESLLTLGRLCGFLANFAQQQRVTKELRERIKTLSRDVRSLVDHADFTAQKITFLLDATLGMINIEQSGIIKIFSVAAVIFLPPTLIASIYGMNFVHMPELSWRFGYPFALVLMVISAILPYLFFKRRGWL